MKPSEVEKCKMSQSAISTFFGQFNMSDPCIRIVLETIFEELYGIEEDEIVFVPSEKR